MPLNIGDVVPDVRGESTMGDFSLHEAVEGSSLFMWCSHPADYTPVCCTELAELARIHGELDARGVKSAAISCNTLESHNAWLEDIKAVAGTDVPFPIIADESREIAVQMGMLDESNKDAEGLPLTVRAVYLIGGADKKVKASILYPASVGRNFNEVIRVIDSLLMSKGLLATPANWQPGDDCCVMPCVSDAEAQEKFNNFRVTDVPSGRSYLRYVSAPAAEADAKDAGESKA